MTQFHEENEHRPKLSALIERFTNKLKSELNKIIGKVVFDKLYASAYSITT